MSKLNELIKEKRPSLSKSSVSTYASILKNLYYNVFGSEDIDLKGFDKTEKILDYLSDVPVNKRKTILSALYILTDNADYRCLMLSDIGMFNKEIDKQEKTEQQKNNWIDASEVEALLNNMAPIVKHLLIRPEFKPLDYQYMQNYIILCLLGGHYIPPRRSKDYVDFKIDNIDTKRDNYMKGNKLYFNSYKTAKTYGQQVVNIPPALGAILRKWISINPNEYLLFDKNGAQLTNVKLNQRLNKIFDGRKVAVNALRHTYLTTKYSDMSDKMEEMNKDFKDMGSSKSQFKTYVKTS